VPFAVHVHRRTCRAGGFYPARPCSTEHRTREIKRETRKMDGESGVVEGPSGVSTGTTTKAKEIQPKPRPATGCVVEYPISNIDTYRSGLSYGRRSAHIPHAPQFKARAELGAHSGLRAASSSSTSRRKVSALSLATKRGARQWGNAEQEEERTPCRGSQPVLKRVPDVLFDTGCAFRSTEAGRGTG
jgi:hypothetical protein